MITVRSTINLAHQSVPNVIPVVQGDTGRTIDFTIADSITPSGAAVCHIQKPSGDVTEIEATIEGSHVLVDLGAEATDETGDSFGQVQITSSGKTVTSFDFIMTVVPFCGLGG